MNNFVFGKYLPLNSIIHKLDPRIKIIALFIMMVSIFTVNNWWAYLLLGIIILTIIFLSKLSISFVIKAFKPMIFMLLFLLVINALTIKTGTILFSIASINIYSDAIINTLFIVVRLLLMIMVTTCLTATTKPLDLTLGLEYILAPLSIIKFPTHEVAMMISIALRFIPTIIEETMRIMDAQKSRGVDFEEGSIKEKITAILSLIVPLFSVAFERAYELADAMEARGYVPGATRTRYRTLKYTFKDFVFLFIALLSLASVIIMRIYL